MIFLALNPLAHCQGKAMKKVLRNSANFVMSCSRAAINALYENANCFRTSPFFEFATDFNRSFSRPLTAFSGLIGSKNGGDPFQCFASLRKSKAFRPISRTDLPMRLAKLPVMATVSSPILVVEHHSKGPQAFFTLERTVNRSSFNRLSSAQSFKLASSSSSESRR